MAIDTDFRDVKARDVKKGDKLGFIGKLKLKLFPTKAFIISMFFSNGGYRQWVVKARGETFKYQGKTYYLRAGDGWYDFNYNQFRLFFFDDFPVPIDKTITRKKGKKEKPFFYVTSSNLEPLIKENYVKELVNEGLAGKDKIMFIIMVSILGLIIIDMYLKYVKGV